MDEEVLCVAGWSAASTVAMPPGGVATTLGPRQLEALLLWLAWEEDEERKEGAGWLPV